MRDEDNSPETPDTEALERKLYDVDANDRARDVFDRADMDPADIEEIDRVIKALVGLRDAERALGIASAKYMKLSTQDMRALHFIMVSTSHGELVTPGILGSRLKLSPASVTKMLNRLEHGGHIIRSVHPVDRRAFSLEVTPETRATATRTLGKHQGRRFSAAARLSSEEREVAIKFLSEMAQELSLDNPDWAFDQPVEN